MNFKIQVLFLLFFVSLRFIFRGKSDKASRNPKCVVIVQLAKLGDMVCTTPLFRAIKSGNAETAVWVVGDSINKAVLEHNRDVDGYIVFNGKNIRQTISMIKKIKADFGCVTGPNFFGLAILYLAGVSSISAPRIENGWSPFETKSYRLIRRLVTIFPFRMGSYAPRERLRGLEAMGIYTDDTKKYLGYSSEADLSVKGWLKNNCFSEEELIVGITPSAGNKIKEWGSEKFARLCDYLYSRYGVRTIVIGGPSDSDIVDDVFKNLDSKTKAIRAQGIFSIDELKALISKLNLFIGVDTGPIYIAEAFGVSTIDIIGPMDEREQPPVGSKHKIVKVNRKDPEVHIMNARIYNHNEARRQIDSVTVEMVTKKVDMLLSTL